MKVLKFGGSSVATSERIKQVCKIINGFVENKEQLLVVVSAFGGVTDQLINMAKAAENGDRKYEEQLLDLYNRHFKTAQELLGGESLEIVAKFLEQKVNNLSSLMQGVYLLQELSPRMLDRVASFGELLSSYIIYHYVNNTLGSTKFIDSREVIKTDSQFGAAKVHFAQTNKLLNEAYDANINIHIMGGFIASDQNNITTTLGRGGSDYTAAIVSAGLGASELEIWTDVDGVMTADPRKVKRAFTLDSMTYEEALEMSHFGAKVIHPPTIQPVLENNIPIRIRNTFNPKFPGTLITRTSKDTLTVKGISSISDVALINIQGSGLIGVTGIAGRLFKTLSQANVNIILITQASSEHSICFAIRPNQAEAAQKAIEQEFESEINMGMVQSPQIQNNLSIVAVVGSKMKKTTGISGKLFKALGNNGVNVYAIAQGSSELNISVVINKSDESKSISALHQAFFTNDTNTINIFLIGSGLIASTLLDQINTQKTELKEKMGLELRLAGLTNSRKMLFNAKGMDTHNWKENLENSDLEANIADFFDNVVELNLPNSILVDCTASNVPSQYYPQILQSSISIVTPNKIANSSSLKEYKLLRQLAKKHDAGFLYETNVGAGLPVISTLKDLLRSGDQITKIEAVLSGSLSFIFNTYNGTQGFADVVSLAKDKGYTEPDPRDDLSGKDVARKALILAREIGQDIEMEDIEIENILPQACIEAPDVVSFMDTLEKHDEAFKLKHIAAAEKGCVLRMLCTIDQNKTQIGLKAVDADNPFYNLSGSDNMIVFTSKRYRDRPLVVKGPGAGAAVTAAGVFAEIIQIGNNIPKM